MSTVPPAEQATVIAKRPDTGARATWSIRPSISALLQDSGRRRLALVAVLITATSFVVPLVFLIAPNSIPKIKNVGSSGLLYFIPKIAAGALVIGICLWRRIAPRYVLWLGFFYELFLCFYSARSTTLSSLATTGLVPMMTFTELLIVFFPLLLPSPPRSTLLVAVCAALTRPVSTVLACYQLDIALPQGWLLASTMMPILAVVFAFVGSKVIYGLGVDVARARQMGSYRLRERLGAGGMGEVWLAEHNMLARTAAIKLIRSEQLHKGSGVTNAAAIQRFEREAQVTASLESPHTVELYDFGRADDSTVYYVMELLRGQDLRALVTQHGPLPPERVVHIVLQICHSLGEAHDAGLVHRDIKPANILLCRYGPDYDFVKVLDFGLVTYAEPKRGEADLTEENLVLGTPAFMSPEAVTGGRVDHRADLYAIGCLFYWLLAGCQVFQERTAMAQAVAHASQTPPPLTALCPDTLPEVLADVAAKCLSKQPEERPQSAAELADLIRAVPLTASWTQKQARAWWLDRTPSTEAVDRAPLEMATTAVN